MKLTKEHIKQIDNYISACGVKWFDVRVELVDHFANNLERKLENNSTLNFKQAIIDEHKNFSDNGFKKLLETKTASVKKQFQIASLKHLKIFFKVPKIILSVISFFVLYKIMNLFEDKEPFFLVLVVVLIVIASLLIYRIKYKYRKEDENRESFLVLDRSNALFQSFYGLMIVFTNITTIRHESSFNNNYINAIQLSFFLLIILFYISTEYIYNRTKEKVSNQYPDIKVLNT